MKKAILRLPLILPAIVLCYGLTISNLIAQTQIGSQENIQLKQLKKLDPKLTIQRDKKTGSPTRLAGKLSESTNKTGTEIAKSFFNKNKTLFRMGDPEKELKIVKVKKDKKNWEHLKYQQVYKGINVENKMIIVHINSKKEIRVINANYLPNIHLDMNSYIPRNAAIQAAITHLNPKKAISKRHQAIQAIPVVYEYNEKVYLSWKITISSEDPLGEFIYYMNAKTGEYIDGYNNLKNAGRVREIYDMKNNTSELPGSLLRKENEGPTEDTTVNSAYDNTGEVYHYYLFNYSRDSFDDNGAKLQSTVHFGYKHNNAFWNGTYMVFGDGDGKMFSSLSKALDVVAHEFTHAVTDHESNLKYLDQSGALNESLSDIFACLIDDDWQIGETCYTPLIPGDALRYMNDPRLGNQPDHMNDFVTPDQNGGQMDKKCYNSKDQDNGCVHFNSGIPNKVAYLIAEGGQHHGITVKGIGKENMGKLFYHMQKHWLMETSTFYYARNASIDAAKNLFPDDTWIHCSVQNAWAAVGLDDACPSPSQNLSPIQKLRVIPVQ